MGEETYTADRRFRLIEKNKNKNKNFIDPNQKYISSKVQPFRENQKQIKSIIVHVT